MKRLLFILLAFVPVFAYAQDDMYFTSGKKKAAKNVANQGVSKGSGTSYYGNSSVTAVDEDFSDNSIVDYKSSSMSDDEYNRRYSGGGVYSGTVTESSSGYDSEDILDADNNEIDYRYSRRILRFHSPNVVVSVSSPYYWDLVYNCGVYDYLYDYYYYDPFYYGWAWNAGWGFGWSWGYRWSPWNAWYGPIWGWSHPHHWTHWGIGPGWAHGGHHGAWGKPGGFGYTMAGRGFARRSYVPNGRSFASGLSRGNSGPRTNMMAGARGYANNGNMRFGNSNVSRNRGTGGVQGGGMRGNGRQDVQPSSNNRRAYSGTRNGQGTQQNQQSQQGRGTIQNRSSFGQRQTYNRSSYNNNSSSRNGSNVNGNTQNTNSNGNGGRVNNGNGRSNYQNNSQSNSQNSNSQNRNSNVGSGRSNNSSSYSGGSTRSSGGSIGGGRSSGGGFSGGSRGGGSFGGGGSRGGGGGRR